MAISNFLKQLGNGLTPNASPQSSGMIAPDFYKQMSDTGNSMLGQQGMQPYTPLQSPYFSNQFMQQHPVAGGALGGALGVLANEGPTPMVSGWGDGLARVAAGLTGNAQMQRQFQQSQAFLPMQIAQNVANYRKTMAPEFIQGKYGNTFFRDPTSGSVTAGPNQNNTGAANADGVFGQLKSMYPTAPENQLRGYAQANSQIPDPEKRSEHLQTAMTQIEGDQRQKQEFAERDKDRHQQFLATEAQRQFTNQLAQSRYDDARNDLVPQAVNTQMQVTPIMQNLNDLEAKLKPLKGQNWPGTFLMERAKYAVGMAPKGGILDGNDIAAASVSQIQGGAAWMKAAGSRNPMIFQKAQEHIFDPWKDSPDLALDKIANLKKNMTDMYNEAATLGHKHNFNPTAMDANGQVVQQNTGAPVNFNPLFAPGLGSNAPANTSGSIGIVRDKNGRITGIQ